MRGRLVHARTGRVLAGRLLRPRTFLGRGLGLMLRPRLAPGEAMWIQPCASIHTFLMRFAIDVIFVDGALRVVGVRRGVPPWRVLPPVRGARGVIELAAGASAAVDLAPGEALVVTRDA